MGSLRLVFVAATLVSGSPPCHVATERFPKQAETLVVPLLNLRRESLTEDPSGKRPILWDLGVRLGQLLRNQEGPVDEALVILVGYYLGEAYDEDVLNEITVRGRRMLPILRRYQQHRPRISVKYPETMSARESTLRQSLEAAIKAIEAGETMGAD